MYRSPDWRDCFQIPLRWLDPVEAVIFSLVRRTVAAKEAGQRLGEGGTRHDCVASGFLGLELEIALHVRDKPHNGGALLELGFQLGNHGERFDAVAVQVDDHQGRFLFRILRQFGRYLFLGFYEFHLNIQLTANLLNFGEKEEIVNESKDLSGGILGSLERFKLGPGGAGTKTVAKTPHLAGARAVALIAIAVVHGTNKDRVPALPAITIAVVAVLAWTALPARA